MHQGMEGSDISPQADKQGICVSVGGDKSATVSFPIAFTKFQRHVLGDNLDEIASWGCSGSIGDLKSIRLWSTHYARYITVVAIGIQTGWKS